MQKKPQTHSNILRFRRRSFKIAADLVCNFFKSIVMSSNENKLFVNKKIIIQGVYLAKTITGVYKFDVVLRRITYLHDLVIFDVLTENKEFNPDRKPT